METQNRGEVLRKGEAIYLDTLKERLEASHMGDYVAIDVDSGDYLIEKNQLQAIKRAQESFGEKLCYLVQIGNLAEPSINFKERKNVAWIFSQ